MMAIILTECAYGEEILFCVWAEGMNQRVSVNDKCILYSISLFSQFRPLVLTARHITDDTSLFSKLNTVYPY